MSGWKQSGGVWTTTLPEGTKLGDSHLLNDASMLLIGHFINCGLMGNDEKWRIRR